MNKTRKQITELADKLGVEIEIELGARSNSYDTSENHLALTFPDGKVWDQLHYLDWYWEPCFTPTPEIYGEAWEAMKSLEDCPRQSDCDVCNEVMA